jgi:hypothetical protein
MRKSKFSEHQIIAILKAVEVGRTVKDVCREHEVSDATYYRLTRCGELNFCDIVDAQIPLVENQLLGG